jgi:heme exporter protein C
MRALIAEQQVEARLRRRALDDDASAAGVPVMEQA